MASAQDSETRPANTTWLGDTGLWFVPTGEVLPNGKWSVSGYRANIDRAQGLTDISHFIGTFGVGVGDRAEIGGFARFEVANQDSFADRIENGQIVDVTDSGLAVGAFIVASF